MLLFVKYVLPLLCIQLPQSRLAPLRQKCFKDLKTCLPPSLIAQIEVLLSTLFVEAELADDLPYFCYLYKPNTIPYRDECVECSSPVHGCMPHRDVVQGEKWKKVCDIFCSERTNNSVTTERRPRMDITSMSSSFKMGKNTRSIILSTALSGYLSNYSSKSENGITDSYTEYKKLCFLWRLES